jgi:hypothetical protein
MAHAQEHARSYFITLFELPLIEGLLTKLPQIVTGRTLEYTEAVTMAGGVNVVKHVGLDMFVGYPFGCIRKEVKFDGQAISRGLQLAHHRSSALLYR